MSFENNNNDKKDSKRSLYNILDKEGFYIILFLCVCIVAVTAIWVSNQDNNYDLAEEDPRIEDPDVTLVEDPGEEDLATDEVANEPNTNNEATGQENTTANQTQDVNATNQVNQEVEEEDEMKEEDMATSAQPTVYNMMMPVVGNLGLPFAEDRLVFHKTLEQWSTNKGIDIHGEEGAAVRAALEGEVIEIVNDTIMGITITIMHDEDLLTRYSNLSTDAMVKVGDYVKKGQVISGVGKTSSIKAVEGSLLHFQVIYDGRHVNPENYLPKFNN
ncbi:M23 family metallopeptidase [Alkaliphilus serpentinus]|uniref:M23 family metallopeptidase n=1 Tax=Alkaliphilus serpentinus TaxID=1482731 RepID=A0A833HLS6_9FIRM|nr:M23 family metallopeptidase [Alkaliphilus serpentinus]KAB3526668.1 M23 family metallopeptidase [Alkaliphilus serpentinus]